MDTASAVLLPELIEEILLNLAHKFLVRFSTVSKSWNSIIFDPVFTRKHKNRAAHRRRHRLVVYLKSNSYEAASFFSLAPVSSDLLLKVTMKPQSSGGDSDRPMRLFSVFSDTNVDATDYVGQFDGKPHLLAYCDELWCVSVKDCLYLWNPSMRNTVQLPRPFSFGSRAKSEGRYFIYGLAYDSVNDDYKILKLRKETELYSLKNNCWRVIKSFSEDIEPQRRCEPSLNQRRCEFVEGRFHWIELPNGGPPIIASFDLSTEKYGEVALPHEYDAEEKGYENYLEVVALRGMLCASLNHTSQGTRFVLWAMEEYGVEKSWTKRFDIMFSSYLFRPRPTKNMTPLFLFENNDLLVKIPEFGIDYMYIFSYGNAETKAKAKDVVTGGHWLYYAADAFLYVESLITHKNFSKNSSSM